MIARAWLALIHGLVAMASAGEMAALTQLQADLQAAKDVVQAQNEEKPRLAQVARASASSAASRMEWPSAGGTSTAEVVDTRVLTKPKEKVATWSFRMQTYGSAFNLSLGTRMQAAASLASGDAEIDLRGVPRREEEDLGGTLYLLLLASTSSEAQDVVRNVTYGHGAEVWRSAMRGWETRVPARFRGTMHWPEGTDVGAAAAAWEKLKDYENQYDKIAETIKIGVTTKLADLRKYLHDSAALDTYAKDFETYERNVQDLCCCRLLHLTRVIGCAWRTVDKYAEWLEKSEEKYEQELDLKQINQKSEILDDSGEMDHRSRLPRGLRDESGDHEERADIPDGVRRGPTDVDAEERSDAVEAGR